MDHKSCLNEKLSVRRSAVIELLTKVIKIYCFNLSEMVQKLQNMAPRCDYDKSTPGNGFRSLVCIYDTIVLHLVSVLRSCSVHRQTMMFRTSYYCKEIESYCAVIDDAVLVSDNCLFPDLSGDYSKYVEILGSINMLDSSCFFGRSLGFQFPPSVGRIFRFIGVLLAIYSLSWEKGRSTLGSFLYSPRFLLNPEQRAERIVKVTHEADIEFCRGFWNLSEFGSHVPRIFCPNMAVNDLREINCGGSITLASTNGGFVYIAEPSSYTGPRPVKIRVLSYSHREILSPAGSPNQLSPSPYLLFHCHGGGYVATTSKSHETYLRAWAKSLNCSIVSVEYSLAPENPFPRPTEEVLFAYAYIISNAAEFGWTGEKICLIGDSAGGNLVMSVTLQLIQLGVERLPDGIVTVYSPFLLQYLLSPSRLLSCMDPLLHMGVMLRCIAGIFASISYCYGKDFIIIIDQFYYYLLHIFSNQHTLENRCSSISSDEKKRCLFYNFSNFCHTILCFWLILLRLSDPLHIHLSSSMYDQRLVDYLQSHPLTKEYTHKRTISQNFANTAAMAAGHALDNISDWIEKSAPKNLPNKPKLGRAFSLSPDSGTKIKKISGIAESHFADIIKNKIPRDPLISPLYASPKDLARLPPVWFIACHLDPLLDDTITFAKKVRDSGGRVMAVDLLDNLPHGFLNFTLVSPECREGSKVCLKRVKEAFGMMSL
ncbi:unnamed protein product [Thelazia callipaeda]|uniref:Hormone-sensitive lipase n=1 Tax=Thelazia callipaeda TaxID=103827 RepID=A0A0N5CL26_THECL|nr:unnamed protein product [Thelazia callipaeda]